MPPLPKVFVHKAHGVVQLRAARRFLLQKRLPAALGFLPQCRQIVCIVQQRVKPCCKVPLPRLLAGGSTPSSCLSCTAFSRLERFSFAARSGSASCCKADTKLSRLPAKRRALPVILQFPPDGMQQKFDRCQPPVERQLLQLRCAAALPAGQNRRKRQLFPPAGIELEERFKRRGNLRVLQKFSEQRAGYRKAQPLIAAKRLGQILPAACGYKASSAGSSLDTVKMLRVQLQIRKDRRVKPLCVRVVAPNG